MEHSVVSPDGRVFVVKDIKKSQKKQNQFNQSQ